MSAGIKKVDQTRELVKTISLLIKFSGLSPIQIADLLQDVRLEQGVSGAKGLSVGSSGGENLDELYGAVLHRWHREVGLLDTLAKPMPLRLLGRAPSLEALIASERPNQNARSLALSMLRAGLVTKRREGQYLPKSRVATVSAPHPALFEHVIKSVARYLKTVERNISQKRGVPTLIERYTQVQDLDRKEIGDFVSFSQSHGSSFLASVDDWLERRRFRHRTNKAAKPSVAAGVHVFAYLEAPDPKVGSKSTRRAKRV